MRRRGWDIPPLDHIHGIQRRAHGFLLALSSFSTLVVTALACGQPCARRLVTGTPGTQLGDMGLGQVGLEVATLAQSQPSHGASLLSPSSPNPAWCSHAAICSLIFALSVLLSSPGRHWDSDHAGSLPAKPVSAPVWLECSGSAGSRPPQKTQAGATSYCCWDPAVHCCKVLRMQTLMVEGTPPHT